MNHFCYYAKKTYQFIMIIILTLLGFFSMFTAYMIYADNYQPNKFSMVTAYVFSGILAFVAQKWLKF